MARKRRRKTLSDNLGTYAKVAGIGVATGVIGNLLYQSFRQKEGKKASQGRTKKIIRGAEHIQTNRWIDKKTFGISNKIITGVAAVGFTAALVEPDLFKRYKYVR